MMSFNHQTPMLHVVLCSICRRYPLQIQQQASDSSRFLRLRCGCLGVINMEVNGANRYLERRRMVQHTFDLAR